MRVAVIINSKAGTVNEALIRDKVEEALFRCELSFASPRSLEELAVFAETEIDKSQAIVICGGDGTINRTLHCLVKLAEGRELPPICLIRSGTANDLAEQMGVHRKVERAARAILEGEVRKIDLIEIESEQGEKTVMLTNGGVGIPAIVAGEANRVRQSLRNPSRLSGLPFLNSLINRGSDALVRKLGSGVYLMMVAEALRQWTPVDWEVDLEFSDGRKLSTKASCILVNNQPRIGKALTPAPYTSNSDGLLNVLVTEAHTLKDQVQAVMSLKSGRPHELSMNKSFEVPEVIMRAREGRRGLTFFGDGEILLKDARQVTVRCRHQALSIVVGSEC